MKWLAIPLLWFFLTGCEEKVKPSIVPIVQGDTPSQESWKSTVTISDSARIKAVLWAGYIAMYSDRQVTVLGDSVHVDFFNDQELRSSTLTARRGLVNDRTRDFEAYDNVIVHSDDGTTLTTDSLFWDNAAGRIHTQSYVEIVSPTEQITGYGMVSDQSLKNYRIFRVSGRAVTK